MGAFAGELWTNDGEGGTFAAIHDACAYIRNDITATIASAYYARANAQRFRQHARQLVENASQLGQQASVARKDAESLATKFFRASG